jgi:hypothetical protein
MGKLRPRAILAQTQTFWSSGKKARVGWQLQGASPPRQRNKITIPGHGVLDFSAKVLALALSLFIP